MMGSRVNDIKKKFEDLTEASKEPSSEFTPTKANTTTNLNVLARKVSDNGSSSSSTRGGGIKRSHAFRSDKLNRNVFNSENPGPIEKSISKTQTSASNDRNWDKLVFKSDIGLDLSKIQLINCRNVVNESSSSNDRSVGLTSSIIRPKTLQLNNTKSISTDVTVPSIKNINERVHSVESVQINHTGGVIHSRNENAENVSNQLESDGLDDGALSNTLKKVLKTPLPPGPPPKKPPRTFAHFTEKSAQMTNLDPKVSTDDIHLGVGQNDSQSMMKPVRSKTESQIMLKKLEIALLNHKTQGKIIKPKTEKIQVSKSNEAASPNNNVLPTKTLGINRSSYSSPVRKTSLPDTPSLDKYSLNNGCFGVLSCSNSVDLFKPSTHVYDVPFESKSQFYLEDFVGGQYGHDLFSKENVLQTNSFHLDKIKSNAQEPIYAKPLVKNRMKNLKCEKGPSVLQIVKSINSNEKTSKPKPTDVNNIGPKGTKLESKKTQPLHYMSSPVWEKVPLLQSPAPSPPEKSAFVQKHLFEKSGTKSFTSRSFSLDIENITIKNNSARSYSIDCPHTDKNLFIDNEKIQKMVNDVYSKCLAMPQDSDSESVASTPDESAPKPFATKEESQKDRHQRTAERKTYLKRVCSRAKSFHRPSVGFPHLFEYLLLVGLDLDPSRCKVPYIKAKYPEDAEVPRGIEHLCFPDAADWPPQASAEEGASRSYCIVITHSSGSRKYGYCRRVQPEGAPICLPLAYCIVSPYKANYYFSQVLAELESRHGQPEQTLSSFIHQLYECPFPTPGQGLLVTNPSTGEKVEMLPRTLDTRQEETDIARLLNLVRFSVFLQVFSTLLLERKVILLSYSISKLSMCIEGLCAALYPFHWQHTLVPIVPSTMLDVCQAPTPYVVGLLKPRDPGTPIPVQFSTIDQVLVVDVDESRVVQCCGDESTVLPPRLCRGLREALHCAVPEKNAPLSPAHNLVASEALIALFVQLVGHYRDHIITSSTSGQREFQRDGFVKSVSSTTVQSFLDWFSETTMFTAFIESRLDRSIEPWGLFEQRCVEHLAQQQAALSKGYRANINKTVKSFGDRFKEWTNSS